MPTATVSTKGQVVIPLEIREAFGIQAGDQLSFEAHGGHIHVSKLGDPLEDLFSGPKVPLRPGEVARLLRGRFR